MRDARGGPSVPQTVALQVLFPVRFGGRVAQFTDERGESRFHRVDAEEVMAMAFDTPVPGYGTGTVNNMRLWSAKASHEFNLGYFSEGHYLKAVEEKNESENLSKVLYPDDSTVNGRALRLKQQYFFVCASLQDILRRFLNYHSNLVDFPEKVAIQLNDTHPSIAIPELMRILMDVHRLEWQPAWEITRRTFSYTNHTLMPEEIMAEVGDENIFIFGMTADDVSARRATYDPWTVDAANAEIKQALDQIAAGYFSVDAPDRFRPIVDALTTNGDRFFVLADYESYAARQEQVDALYRDPDEWTRRAILNIAGMGRFSSDRAVLEYAKTIWAVNPVRH